MRLKLLLPLLILVFVPTANADKPCRINCGVQQPMGRVVTSGFELQTSIFAGSAQTDPDGNGSTGSVETTIVRSGAASRKFLPGNIRTFKWTASALGDVFVRAYIYVPTGGLPDVRTGIVMLQPAITGSPTFMIRLEHDGTLTLWAVISGVFVQQGSASVSINLDQWNKVELRGNINTGATDAVEGRLNDISFASTSGLTVAATDNQNDTLILGLGTEAVPGSGTIYFDDIAVNDAGGANQNSWPGSGKIVLLKPLSDSAKGTGWTDDQAATTNLFNDVDNTPPLGIADTTTGGGGHQLRNATSNANVNYDANMQSYVAAGIGSSDSIVVIDPIIATGAPVTTSSKQGTVGVVSNPTIANIALGATGTAGAFWQGNAAGTFPTGWKWSHGTITYAPAVTKATQPVMRVTQVTASTRIAMVCFMGMYVEYLPASSLVTAKPGSAHARHRRAAQSFDRW